MSDKEKLMDNKVVDFDVKFEGSKLCVDVKVDTNQDGEYAVCNKVIIELGEVADEIKDKFL